MMQLYFISITHCHLCSFFFFYINVEYTVHSTGEKHRCSKSYKLQITRVSQSLHSLLQTQGKITCKTTPGILHDLSVGERTACINHRAQWPKETERYRLNQQALECGEFYYVTGICDCDIEYDVVAGIGTCGRVFSIFYICIRILSACQP